MDGLVWVMQQRDFVVCFLDCFKVCRHAHVERLVVVVHPGVWKYPFQIADTRIEAVWGSSGSAEKLAFELSHIQRVMEIDGSFITGKKSK